MGGEGERERWVTEVGGEGERERRVTGVGGEGGYGFKQWREKRENKYYIDAHIVCNNRNIM